MSSVALHLPMTLQFEQPEGESQIDRAAEIRNSVIEALSALPGVHVRLPQSLSMTHDESQAYITWLDNDCSTCPCCGSTSIEGGPVDVQGTEAIQECSCNECSATWTEGYTASQIHSIRENS